MRYKESEYKYAVRTHYRNAKGTTLHTKHMTKKAAIRSKKAAIANGDKAYIVKLK